MPGRINGSKNRKTLSQETRPSRRRPQRHGDGRRLARRIDGQDQGRIAQARAADRPGGYLGAAGLKNRARLVQARTTRRSFRDLSPAGCPFPACVAPADAAGAFRRGGRSGGHRPASGSGAWAARGPGPGRSGTAICWRASARARLLPRNMLPTALRASRIGLPPRADEAR